MEKKHVYLKKELVDYKCKICKRMVIVSQATERTIETDKSIIHTWDYGHHHQRVFEVDKNGQIPIENTLDYE